MSYIGQVGKSPDDVILGDSYEVIKFKQSGEMIRQLESGYRNYESVF